MLICTFAGHRNVFDSSIEAKVRSSIDELLQEDDEFIFYTGGIGEFDDLCSTAVRAAKKKYINKKIKLILCEPYMKQSINKNKEFLYTLYDDIEIPITLMGCHPKGAIEKRNRLMVEQSDFLIAYVTQENGGAFRTLKYAIKIGVPFVNLSNNTLVSPGCNSSNYV